MARSTLAAILLISTGFMIGCQPPVARIDPLPSPSLDGPVVIAPKAAAQPVAVAPAPIRPSPETPTARTGTPGIPDDWIPRAQVTPWRWIVIHHSATPSGNASVFDREHRQKGWDELGYHFVIGNGTGSGDGQIEVGPRWPKQKWGAHAKTPDNQFNNYGIGICLVGNFDLDRPSAAQVRSLTRLVAHLMKTYHIPASHVIGHGETKPTDCPGRHVHVAEIRRDAAQYALEEAGLAAPPQAKATTELLRDASR